MGLCFLCSHCFASAWLLLTIAVNAAAATANLALVFLAGDPLLPNIVAGSKLATSLVALFGLGLSCMTVTLSSKVTLGLCWATGSCGKFVFLADETFANEKKTAPMKH